MVVSYLVHVQNGETKSVTLEGTEKGGAIITGKTNPEMNLQKGK